MPEPSSYVIAKLASGIGGLFGGLTLMSFIKPKSIADAAVRGGVSTGSGIIFSSPVLAYFNMKTDWELLLAMGCLIGFVSWSLFSIVARTFKRTEESKNDIFDFIGLIRPGVARPPAAPPKKRARRKTTRKPKQ